jgi:hypothetical protein
VEEGQEEVMGARFIAQFDSEDGCECGQDIEAGDSIGYLGDTDELGCKDCVAEEDETNANWQWQQM